MRKIINIKPLTLTETQPAFQIHTSFSSFSFERTPISQLLTGGGWGTEEWGKKKGKKKRKKGRNRERNIK